MRESVTVTMETEPNGYVTAATDAAGLIAPIAGKVGGNLGRASAIINFANDPSAKSAIEDGLPFLVPETGVPLTIYGTVDDGSSFVANQIIIPVFTPDASQAATMDDGNGSVANSPLDGRRQAVFVQRMLSSLQLECFAKGRDGFRERRVAYAECAFDNAGLASDVLREVEVTCPRKSLPVEAGVLS